MQHTVDKHRSFLNVRHVSCHTVPYLSPDLSFQSLEQALARSFSPQMHRPTKPLITSSIPAPQQSREPKMKSLFSRFFPPPWLQPCLATLLVSAHTHVFVRGAFWTRETCCLLAAEVSLKPRIWQQRTKIAASARRG